MNLTKNLGNWAIEGKSPKEIKIPKNKIVSFYFKKKLSTRNIAKIFGCSKGCIDRKFKKYNLKKRNRKQSLQISQKKLRILLPKKCNLNNPDFAYILGVRYGDGSLGKRRLELKVKDLDFVQKFKERIGEIGLNSSSIKKDKFNMYSSYVNSTNFAEFIKKIKIIDLGNLPKICKKQFIIGFFDSEGSINCHIFSAHYKNRHITFCNTNIKLIEFIKNSLQKFEIKSHLNKQLAKSLNLFGKTYYPRKKFIYRLFITSRPNFIKFHKLGKLICRKEVKLIELLNSYKNDNYEI